jgi:hypothetical protein
VGKVGKVGLGDGVLREGGRGGDRGGGGGFEFGQNINLGGLGGGNVVVEKPTNVVIFNNNYIQLQQNRQGPTQKGDESPKPTPDNSEPTKFQPRTNLAHAGTFSGGNVVASNGPPVKNKFEKVLTVSGSEKVSMGGVDSCKICKSNIFLTKPKARG